MQAHVLLNFINSSNESKVSSWKQREDVNSNVMHSVSDLEACIADSCKIVANSYGLFKNKANEQVNGASIFVCWFGIRSCLQLQYFWCLALIELALNVIVTIEVLNLWICGWPLCFSILVNETFLYYYFSFFWGSV